MNYTDDFDFCRPYIAEGERVLWTGRPEKGGAPLGRELALVPFSIIWLGFCVFWEITAIKSGAPFFMALWGLPFIAVGLYLLFGRFIYASYLKNRTYYVITNKKLIIRRGSKIEIYNGVELPPMSVRLHKNGNGTIIFSEETYVRRGRRLTYIALENISEINQAQSAINILMQERA